MDRFSFPNGRVGNRIIWVTMLSLCIGAGFGISPGGVSAAPTQSARLYSATGHSLRGAFLNYFDKYGGVRIFGYPISEEVQENGRPVQYFERQRFEYYKEAAGTSNEVQGSRLGATIAKGKVSTNPVSPVASTSNRIYFKETGHSISYPFMDFWEYNGDLRIFGYPISEIVNENGNTVQYFERARMEYHPQKAAAGYGVELGQLGKEYVQAHPDVASKASQTYKGTTSTAGGSGTSGNSGASNTTPQQASSAQAVQLSAREKQLMDYINGARQASGLKPVAIDSKINAVARSRSNDMAARGYFAHTTPEGKSFMDFFKAASISYKLAGEIIATNNYRAEETAYNAYDGFINSPAHRSIILDSRYNLAGVGEAKDSRGFYFFTVDFVQR